MYIKDYTQQAAIVWAGQQAVFVAIFGDYESERIFVLRALKMATVIHFIPRQ